VRNGTWLPFPLAVEGPKSRAYFFVDDVILFAEASMEQPHMISQCLNRFFEASGQKVSSSKSSIFFSANTDPTIAEGICSVLNMTKSEDLGRYLGVPTLHKQVTKETYHGVIDRVEKRLTGWKSKCLSLAGRFTLIKSTSCDANC